MFPSARFNQDFGVDYKNVRREGRSIVEVDDEAASNLKRIFQLYAYENQTVDGIIQKLAEEARVFRPSQPKFPRASVYNFLPDRAYIGELEYKGNWYPGKHKPIIDRVTWDRVQVLMGDQNYHSHQLTYGGEFMRCGHCGKPVTGECKTKQTKAGPKDYIYYRCARYTAKGHPRIRVPEQKLDEQMLEIFDSIRIEDESVRDWFRAVLASADQRRPGGIKSQACGASAAGNAACRAAGSALELASWGRDRPGRVRQEEHPAS